MALKCFIVLLLSCLCSYAQMGLRSPVFVSAATAPSSSTFSPSNISGMQLWFRPEELPALANGSYFSNWPSALPSQPSRYATNFDADTVLPRITNSFAGLGMKGIYWDGSDERLHISNALSVSKNIDSMSIVSLIRLGDTAGGKAIIAFNKAAGSVREYDIFDATENFTPAQRSLDSESAPTSATNFTASPITLAWCYQTDHIHTNRTAVSGSAIVIYTNSVLATNCVPAGTSTNTLNTDLYAVHLGCAGASGGSPFKGEMAEIMVFVPMLTTAERTQVYAYLKSRYSSLP